MTKLNRNETIQAFASAASLLIEQYITSERAGWDICVLPASNAPAKLRKVS